jgi:hypothetical protein
MGGYRYATAEGAMPPKTNRRARQGVESQQAILDATMAIAAERGYERTTIALVSERSGLPASSIYWHFRNKDELLSGRRSSRNRSPLFKASRGESASPESSKALWEV